MTLGDMMVDMMPNMRPNMTPIMNQEIVGQMLNRMLDMKQDTMLAYLASDMPLYMTSNMKQHMICTQRIKTTYMKQ